MFKFSFFRMLAILLKEFVQMKRDRGTFALIIGIPLIQVILFGFAINSNPKHLPTALIDNSHSVFSRAFVQSLANTNYFHFIHTPRSEAMAEQLLKTNQAQFIVNIPSNFAHLLIRQQQSTIVLEADATDPAATGYAIAAASTIAKTCLLPLLPHTHWPPTTLPRDPIQLIIHAKYNPNQNTQYNIVPGLMGVVLTMTMVMITAIAITRERERGTMEHLLATPLTSIEVVLGKVLPYLIVGYIQVLLILIAAYFLFHIPIQGSLGLLTFCILFFVMANLSVGLMLSTIARNQLQAMQMTTFFFLPSLLLSGFMFPFTGMPLWAQTLGNILPLTHFLRIARGILLKGNTWVSIWPDLWPMILFLGGIILVGILRFKRTLDE